MAKKRIKFFGGSSEKPIENVELSEKTPVKRIIIAALLLVLGIALIGVAVRGWLSVDDGWRQISPSGSLAVRGGADIIFQYDIGKGELSARDENFELTALYSEACEAVYGMFDADVNLSSKNNIYYLCRNTGQSVTVEEPLYKAFELALGCGTRFIYAQPMFDTYFNVFFEEDDEIAEQYDPTRNSEMKSFLDELASFVNDESSVKLELLGDCKVILTVSEEYRAFAEKNGITAYIGFSFAKNAFAVDYLADTIEAQGYTYGNISSNDGFIRNLDGRGTQYSFNLFNKKDGSISLAARFDYSRPTSLVFMRAYGLSESDGIYHTYEDGTVTHGYLDPVTGIPKNSLQDLVAYSENTGCAKILMSVMPIFIADTLDEMKLASLSDTGIHSIRFDGEYIIRSDKNASVTALENVGGTVYKLK